MAIEARIPPELEEEEKVDIRLKPEPVLGVSVSETSRPVAEAARKDIQMQKEGVSFSDVMAGKVDSVGKFTVTPQLLDAAKNNKTIMRRLVGEYTRTMQASPDKYPKPFMRGSETFIPKEMEKDAFAMSVAERSAQMRKELDTMLQGFGIEDPEVRDIFNKEFRTGDFYSNLESRLAQAGQFVPTALAGIPILSYHAAGAAKDALLKGTNPVEEFRSRGSLISGAFESSYNALDVTNPTMKQAFNNGIRSSLQERLDNGEITQEQFDEKVFVRGEDGEFLTDESGERVQREFLSQDQAQSILDLSFNQLPTQEKFAVMFIENIAGIGGPGTVQSAIAVKNYKRAVAKATAESPALAREIKGKSDAFEILDIIEKSGVKTSVNKNALSIGLSQAKTSRSMDILTDQIAEAGRDIDALLASGVKKSSTTYKLAVAQHQNLKARMLRAKYTLRAVPYIKAAGTEALVISVGQLGAREYLPTKFDISPESAEAIGAIGMVVVGAPLARYAGSKTLQATSTIRGGAPKVLARTLDFLVASPSLGRGTRVTQGVLTAGASEIFLRPMGLQFTDRTRDIYEQSIGRKLTPEEIKGIDSAIRMMNNLDDANRQKAMDALFEYKELQDRIVGSFPEEMRKEAQENFTLSFAQASSLSPLSALNVVNINKVDVRSLKDFDANGIADGIKMSMRQVKLTELALENMSRLSQQADNPEVVAEFVAGAKEGLQGFKKAQMKVAEDHMENMDIIKNQVLSDPTVDIPENFLPDLTRADKSLKEALGQTVDERKSIGEAATSIYNGIANQVTSMKTRRQTGGQHIKETYRRVEDILDTHLDDLYLRGDAAYNNVRKMSETAGPIDLTNAVEEMVEMSGQSKDKMHLFFSPNGTFFAGKLARQNRQAFDQMVERALPEIGELKDVLIQNGVSQERIEAMSNLEFALELKRINPDFNPFSQVNAYEVDVMRRMFSDYGYKVRDARPGLKAEYDSYADVLDRTIADSNYDVYQELLKARKTYHTEVGDRLRAGGFLYKFQRSQGTRKEIVEIDDMSRHAYANIRPETMFNGYSDNLTKAMKGDVKAEEFIVAQTEAIVTEFGETVGGKRVFDLTTEKGMAKFKALQGVIGEKVYGEWVEKNIKIFERTEGTQAALLGGYKFDNALKDVDEVSDLMMVPVRTLDEKGQVVTKEVPFINLGTLYRDSKELGDLVRSSKDLQARYTNFVADYNVQDSVLRRNIQNNIKYDEDAFTALKPFVGEGGIDPNSFYKDYVQNGSVSIMGDLRENYVTTLVNNAGKTAEEADQMFVAATSRLVTDALLERAGKRAVPEPEALEIARQRGVPVAFKIYEPENLLSEIRDNSEVLSEILEPQHLSYLEDIGTFLVRAKDSDASISGAMRGYSVQEGLSRVYNIARGMVSPLYVTSEFAVRLAGSANVEILQLAAGNMQAAEIITTMFKTPELVTKQQIDILDALLYEFVFTEMARQGMAMPTVEELFSITESNDDEQE